MSMRSFESLIDHVDPGFICFLAGDPLKNEGYLKRVEHLANPPAESSLLAKIPAVPGVDAAREFYGRFDGALLYTARDSMGGLRAPGLGVEIFPIEEWPDHTAQTVDSWTFEEFDDSKMPYSRDEFVSFAYSRGTSNPIHWVVRGPAAGTIYRWAWTMPPDPRTPGPPHTSPRRRLRCLHRTDLPAASAVLQRIDGWSLAGRTGTEGMDSEPLCARLPECSARMIEHRRGFVGLRAIQ